MPPTSDTGAVAPIDDPGVPKRYALTCRRCASLVSFDAADAEGLVRCDGCGTANLFDAPEEA